MRETVVEGETGVFFDAPEPAALVEAVRGFDAAGGRSRGLRRATPQRFDVARFRQGLRASSTGRCEAERPPRPRAAPRPRRSRCRSAQRSAGVSVAVVVPSWNGRRWLPGLPRVAAPRRRARPTRWSSSTTARPTARSTGWRARRPDVRVLALGRNTRLRGRGQPRDRGRGGRRRSSRWSTPTSCSRPTGSSAMAARWRPTPACAAVACKMVGLDDPARARRRRRRAAPRRRLRAARARPRATTGAGTRRARSSRACAGAALYRRSAVLDGRRLRRALLRLPRGRRPRPAAAAGRLALRATSRAVARHAGGGSSARAGAARWACWVARNTLLLRGQGVPGALGCRSSPTARPRGCGTPRAAGALRRAPARRAGAALPLLPAMLRERARRCARGAVVPIEDAVPRRPWRGPRAGGHPRSGF